MKSKKFDSTNCDEVTTNYFLVVVVVFDVAVFQSHCSPSWPSRLANQTPTEVGNDLTQNFFGLNIIYDTK